MVDAAVDEERGRAFGGWKQVMAGGDLERGFLRLEDWRARVRRWSAVGRQP
jgi:hypothetical protein